MRMGGKLRLLAHVQFYIAFPAFFFQEIGHFIQRFIDGCGDPVHGFAFGESQQIASTAPCSRSVLHGAKDPAPATAGLSRHARSAPPGIFTRGRNDVQRRAELMHESGDHARQAFARVPVPCPWTEAGLSSLFVSSRILVYSRNPLAPSARV